MGICHHHKKQDLEISIERRQWPDSPQRRHTGESFRYGTDLFINLREGSIEQFYDIGEVLGVGAFGSVKLATEKQTHLKRALKTIAKKMVEQEDQSKMFAEVSVLRKLDHPNIMKLYGLYADRKNYYLITELLDGGELIKKIQNSRTFTETEAAMYMKQILSALQYCHKHNIVHRDLKLENLIFDSNQNLKVIDFGTSKKILQEKYLTKKLGTPNYTAPEVLKGKYTEKCDIWSCGVILYTLLCGYFPFNGPDARTTQILIEIGRYTFEDADWKHISRAAKDLIKSMLRYNPEDRITAEEAYNNVWIQGLITPNPLDQRVLRRLSSYYKQQVVKDLIMQFMTMHIMTNEDKNEVLQFFKQIDFDGDGQISKQDLLKAYQNQDDVNVDVDEIIKQCDTLQNGYISFNNFLNLMMQEENKKKLDKLETAFKIFDRDNDGLIKRNNVEDVLGKIVIEDQHWQQVLDSVDKDKDGMISKEEFFELIQNNL